MSARLAGRLRRSKPAQTGVALLTVLFMLVLITTMAVYMVEDEHLIIRRASNQRDLEQGFQMVSGAEQWVAKVLERDLALSQTDHLNEDWRTLVFAVELEEGTLSAQVDDLQGRFNLNNLAAGRDQVWYPAFQRLLGLLQIEEGLADAVVDWIDGDQEITGGTGAEDAEYLGLDPPYRTANRPFTSVSELRWVKGFDEKTIAELQPFVAALPATDLRINVNTAPIPVLRVLAKQPLSEAAAQGLLDGRGDEGYATENDFLATTEMAGTAQQTAAPMISVTSSYFQVLSRAEYGRFSTVLYSVLERRDSTGQVLLMQRRRGLI